MGFGIVLHGIHKFVLLWFWLAVGRLVNPQGRTHLDRMLAQKSFLQRLYLQHVRERHPDHHAGATPLPTEISKGIFTKRRLIKKKNPATNVPLFPPMRPLCSLPQYSQTKQYPRS